MLSVLVQTLPRSIYNLTNNCSQPAGLRHVRSLRISNGGIALKFSWKCRSLRCISLHRRLTESPCDYNRASNISSVARRGGRGICFCKNDKISPDDALEKGFKRLEWPILKRWEVPWDWKTTLLTMITSGLSFLLAGLAESAVISYLGISQKHFMSLDERAMILFVNQFLTTALGLAVIYALVSRYQPLPDDLFCYSWKEPFSLQNGWLLWGGVGLITASITIALAGAIVTALNGEPPQREADALLRLLPLIGASNTSTAYLIGVTGVLAPLFEETIFRGFLMTSLTKWLPTPMAVLVSASIFAFAHLTPGEFPQLFVLGAVLGFAYAQTRNLLTPVTIHAFWNSGVIILLTFLRLQGYDIREFFQ